jgi:putative ABC transport system permease protein
VTLDEKQFRVIGVFPDRDAGLAMNPANRVWIPLAAQNPRTLYGRLRRDASPTQARAALETVAKRMGFGIRMFSLSEYTYGDDRPQLLMMLGAVVLVLLIACADVANLLLAHSARRVREMTVRAAIGASRARLVRQSMVESLVLALMGGAAGVWIAGWLPLSVVLLASRRALPASALSVRALGFALAASVVTALLCGILPALQASRTDVSAGLKDAANNAIGSRRSNRWRGALVAAEIALSLTLLAGAASLIQSFLRLRPANPGFEIENRVVLSMQLAKTRFRTPEQQADFAERSMERLTALPGVQHAAISTSLPISGLAGVLNVLPAEPGARGVRTRYQAVSPNYFAATGTRLLAGRTFDRTDRSGTPVAIVNQAFANKFLNGSALGRSVVLEYFDKTKSECVVVGVAGDVQLDFEPRNDRPMVYLPFAQKPEPWFQIVLMTPAAPESIGSAARRELAALDPRQPVQHIEALKAIIHDRGQWATNRAVLMSGMAGLALLLAAMGIYAVMACAVAERTREIRIRVALGARGADVLGTVARQGMVQLMCGLALGVFGAWGGTRLLVKNFYQVFPVGTGTFALAAAGLIVIAALATILPARRALRVDPLETLRYE